jgi:hypothetical protein
MAGSLQMGWRVVVMGEACNEAEAPGLGSCRVIARGSCVFPMQAPGRGKSGGWRRQVYNNNNNNNYTETRQRRG